MQTNLGPGAARLPERFSDTPMMLPDAAMNVVAGNSASMALERWDLTGNRWEWNVAWCIFCRPFAAFQQSDVDATKPRDDPDRFAALVAVVGDGGKVVSTTASMATPGDGSRGVSAATVFVLPDRDRLTELASSVDSGDLQVEVTRRIPLTELPAGAAAGRTAGKVVVGPA